MKRYLISGITVFLFLTITLACRTDTGQTKPGPYTGISLIPKPSKIVSLDGRFVITPQTRFEIDGDYHLVMPIAGYFSDLLKRSMGWSLSFASREVAFHITDKEGYFISESSVYRILKSHDLVTSPVYTVISAKDHFEHPTSRVNELWQKDFITSHIPDKGQVMIRYYGIYANAHRGKKKKAGVNPSCPPIIEDEASFIPSRGWAEMIRKVYEIDPLICPKCGGTMPACA